MTRISRRRFLVVASGSVVACTAGASILTSGARSSAQPVGAAGITARDALLGVVTEPRTVDEIGGAYLALHPEEADADVLVAALAPPGSAIEQARGATLTRGIRRGVRDDFARGDIVRLDGWQLSRTGARLCALSRIVEAAPGARAP